LAEPGRDVSMMERLAGAEVSKVEQSFFQREDPRVAKISEVFVPRVRPASLPRLDV
jgi:hypothetical protein